MPERTIHGSLVSPEEIRKNELNLLRTDLFVIMNNPRLPQSVRDVTRTEWQKLN